MSRADRLAFRPGGVRMERSTATAPSARPRSSSLGPIAGACCEPGGLGAGRGARAGREPRTAADRKADFGVLNYALSLEYLQAAFYTEAERLSRSGRVQGAGPRGRRARARPRRGSAGAARSAAIKQPSSTSRASRRISRSSGRPPSPSRISPRPPTRRRHRGLNNPEFLAAAIASIRWRPATPPGSVVWPAALPAADAFDRAEVEDRGQAAGRVDEVRGHGSGDQIEGRTEVHRLNPGGSERRQLLWWLGVVRSSSSSPE